MASVRFNFLWCLALLAVLFFRAGSCRAHGRPPAQKQDGVRASASRVSAAPLGVPSSGIKGGTVPSSDRGRGVPSSGNKVEDGPASIRGGGVPDIRKIDLAEARRLFDEGRAVFVDGRAPSSYATRHIKGAVNCSLAEFEEQANGLENRVGKEGLLIVYCGGETCGLADRVARDLSSRGFKNLLIFSGGWSAWIQAGAPAEP